MSKRITFALVAGLISASLFLLVAIAGLGFFFMFLPTLPLFFIGLSKDHWTALIAGAIASMAVGIFTGPEICVLFMLCFALPAWYMARQSLWWRPGKDGAHEWYPIGFIMVHLTIGASLMVAAVTLFYMSQGESIVAILAEEIRAAFSDLQEDYGDVIATFATQWSFLIFSMTIWIWGLALFAHAWVANRILVKRKEQIRPDLSLDIFPMPNWMLGLLVICGLASLIGSESVQFLGNAVFIGLMLPYFLLGCALMHKAAKTWPSRRFFLFFVYFMVFAQFWPALILSGVGLFHHIKYLNKHLSSGDSSFKS